MRAFLIFIFVSCASGVGAQEIFSGLVADSATFESLSFVTIQVKNKNKGTTSGTDGGFRISATRTDTLRFSYVGYKTIEFPLADWEPGIILMTEVATLLDDFTITDERDDNPYEGMFDEQNEAWRRANKRLPFYYSRGKRQKTMMTRLSTENIRVQTYVNVIVKNESLQNTLQKKYDLTEDKYFEILGDFNARYYSVMYYLSAPELLTLVNNFFETHARQN